MPMGCEQGISQVFTKAQLCQLLNENPMQLCGNELVHYYVSGVGELPSKGLEYLMFSMNLPSDL